MRGVALVSAPGSLQPWQGLYRSSCSLFGDAKVVEHLEIQPELRTGAEEVAEPQRSIAGDRALTAQNAGHPVRRQIVPGPTPGEREQIIGETVSPPSRRELGTGTAAAHGDDYELCERGPLERALWEPALERHTALFGHTPHLAVADGRFASRHNERVAPDDPQKHPAGRARFAPESG